MTKNLYFPVIVTFLTCVLSYTDSDINRTEAQSSQRTRRMMNCE